MRTLHLHSGNVFGGIETMLVTIARESLRRGEAGQHAALCYDGRVAEALIAAGAAVSILGDARLSRPLGARRACAALEQVLHRVHPEVVIVHLPWAQAIFGGTVKRLGYPLVLWMHGPATGWLSRAAALRRPDAILCNSGFTARSIPKSQRSIPHAVVHPPSAPPPPDARRVRQDTRRELGAADDVTVIVQVSRLESWKGHEIHLRAVARLRDVGRWALWIIGGPQLAAEARYENALRDLAAQLGVADRVKFLGQRDDVARLLAAADVYCQPNTAPEPFGLSYVEALAAGLPVIATDLGGAREIVTPDAGMLVRPRDIEDLEAAMRRLVADRPARERFGRNGPARAAALCDPGRQMQAVAELLGNVARRVA